MRILTIRCRAFRVHGACWALLSVLLFHSDALAQDSKLNLDWQLPAELAVVEDHTSSRLVVSNGKNFSVGVSKGPAPIESKKAMDNVAAMALFELSGTLDEFVMHYEDRNFVVGDRTYVLFIYSHRTNGNPVHVYSYHTWLDERMLNLVFECSSQDVLQRKDQIADIMDSLVLSGRE